MDSGTHSFGMEPSISSYIAGLNAAEKRITAEAHALVAANPDFLGAFSEVTSSYGQVGIGDLEGWSLMACGTVRGAAFLTAADTATVGYVRPHARGGWVARHDRFNRRPSHCECGWVSFDDLDEAYAYIALADAAHMTKYGR